MPEAELEIQLEPKPEPLTLTAVFFWGKKRAYVCSAVLAETPKSSLKCGIRI